MKYLIDYFSLLPWLPGRSRCLISSYLTLINPNGGGARPPPGTGRGTRVQVRHGARHWAKREVYSRFRTAKVKQYATCQCWHNPPCRIKRNSLRSTGDEESSSLVLTSRESGHYLGAQTLKIAPRTPKTHVIYKQLLRMPISSIYSKVFNHNIIPKTLYR